MSFKQKSLVAAFVSVFSLAAYGQTGGSGQAGGTATTPPPPSSRDIPSGQTSATQGQNRDALLLGYLHHVNEIEVQLANLAKDNASSADVKNFADHISKDHQAADEQVIALAKNRNVDLAALQKQKDAMMTGSATAQASRMAESGTGGGTPHDAMAEHKAEIEKLRTLKGPEFDREYTRVMVKEHQAVVDKLTTARSQISDQDTIKLVDQLLPKQKQHLAMAQKLQDSLSKS
jgi:putative membrane protein